VASSPDLFVVCKNCGSQVSPYVTECPYCGNRIRKRAPKIERPRRPENGPSGQRPQRRKRELPSLGPLRTGEIPGIRGDEFRRPVLTLALVAIGALWWIALIPLRDEGYRLVLDPLGEWWQVLTAPFLHASSWYQFAALFGVGIFGWLLERRHGWLPMLLVWLLGASGGMAIVKALGENGPLEPMGASGGALALLCAWAVPHLLARRAGRGDEDFDRIGAAVFFTLLAVMPLARPEVSWIATAAGVVIGSLCGLVLARAAPR